MRYTNSDIGYVKYKFVESLTINEHLYKKGDIVTLHDIRHRGVNEVVTYYLIDESGDHIFSIAESELEIADELERYR